MKVKTKKKRKARRSFIDRAHNDPNYAVMDFDHLASRAPYVVSGTAPELVRDGYDNPQTWIHNSHACPDDRETAFLVGRGYSATDWRLKLLVQSGIPWMAVNNYPSDPLLTPTYWCSGDPPSYFGERLWNNSDIMKFTAYVFSNVNRPREDAYAPALTSLQAPNTHFFHHVNNMMEPMDFLHTPYIAWGTTIAHKTLPQFHAKAAARSSMLIGLRLLWHLGYRKVYLLGCDCTPHQHAMPEYYNVIFHLLSRLVPVFDRFGFEVFQTNPFSHLRCFRFAEFQEALEAAA